MTTESPHTPGEQPEAEYKSQPLVFVIGTRRYRIDSAVRITAMRPRRAEVIPIDRLRMRGHRENAAES
jgi:hypothetical protein